jgi:hypothetical protein
MFEASTFPEIESDDSPGEQRELPTLGARHLLDLEIVTLGSDGAALDSELAVQSEPLDSRLGYGTVT